MSILIICLRAVFLAATALAIAGNFSDRIAPGWRRTGMTVAVVAGIVLLVARIALRVWMPERVPSFSG